MAIALILLGVVAGVASGMFGIGGGVIIVPALMALGFSQVQANGTSLAALLLPVAIFGVLSYHRNGMIRWRVALMMSAGLLVGGYVGARIANSINAGLLLRLYGLFLIYVGWRMVMPIVWWRTWRGNLPPAPPEAESTREREVRGVLPVASMALVAGVASGMFGIGGGAIIVPILVTFMGYGQKVAVATSLGALMPPVGLLAAWEYYRNGQLALGAAVPVAAGLVIGAWFGARLTISLPSETVKRLYGIFLLVIALRFLWGA